MHRSFHMKRLLIVLAVLLVVSGGLFAINHVQARRQASIIKTVAQKAEEGIDGDAERRGEAIALYNKYLKFNPNDEEAAVKYARLLLDQYKADPHQGHAADAASGVELVLRRFPDHPKERKELIDIYLKSGKVRHAHEHIEVLFNTPNEDFKNDAEVLEMSSLCELLLGQNQLAIERLEEAIKTGKAPIRVYQQVLQLLNGDKGERSASKIADYLRTLKEKDPWRTSLEARIAVARFEMFRRQYENARQDLDYARQKLGGENNPDTLHAAAELELATIRTYGDIKTHLAAARNVLEQAMKLDSKNVQVGLLLADVLDKQGDRPRSVEVLRETAKAYGPINDQFWVLIDYLIDLHNQDVAATLVDRAEAANKNDPRVGYYRGRLAILNSDWMQAKTLLEEAAPKIVSLRDHHKRAMLGLGIVYGVLQNPDQQLSCFRTAVRDDPGYTLALIGEAESLAKLGRYDEAITRYQVLVTTFQLVELRPTLVRLRLLDMLRKPPENRNWTKFDSEDTLGKPDERTSEVSILYAHSLAARGEREKAIVELNKVLAKDPKNVYAWVALARIQEAGKPDAALRILDVAIKTVGDTVELRLARADVLVFLTREPHASDFEILGLGIDKFPKPDQYRLLFGLGQATINAMYRVLAPEPRKALQDAAIDFLRRAGKADPLDLHCRAVLVDLALTVDRKDVLEATIDELASLEGPNGPISTLARVSIRLNDVKKQPNAEAQLALIKELRELTNKVQQQRQGWGRVYVALGRLDELEGLNDQAVEHYRKAINEGDRDETVIRKAVALYRERKMDAQAAGMLDELATKMVLPEDLERYRTIFELLNKTIPKTERATIERIAPATSTDSRILLLRGSLLAAIREDVDALKAFRRALDIDDVNADNWDALIRQFVRMGDLASAKTALVEAENKLLAICRCVPPQKTALERAEILITLGGCSEICGDIKTAGERLHEALKVAPKEVVTNKRVVEYYLRTGRSKEADQLLEALAEDPAQDLARWARRFQAGFALMSSADAYNHRGRALALIARNLAQANDPQDIKARAVILTVDPATREEGIQVLKDYWSKGDLTPDESYHLGMLIFSQGPSKIAESVKFFESAARPRPGVTVEHITGLIRVYLALDKLEYAEPLLERLRTAVPNTWDVTREEARILMKKSQAATFRGDRDDAKKLSEQALALIKLFPAHDSPAAIRQRSGPLLAELGFTLEAEQLYRRLLDKPDSPTAYIPLVVLYIQNKRSEEAIALAFKYESQSPLLLTAQLLSGAVRIKRPQASVESQVETWLNEKVQQYTGKPEHAGLLAARAELLHAQDKYAESIAEYRRALKEGPNDFAANNVAMLIALYSPKDVDEAIRLITHVIDLRGPVSTYLDTRAVCYIVKGGEATEKAVEDLKMARLQQSRAVYSYHLAWAYELQQKRPERDKMLDEAKRIGLDIHDLHPLEREIYHKLYGPNVK